MNNDLKNNIIGYDNNGQVADCGNCIKRTINPSYYHFAKEIYHIYKNKNLNKIGIVNTELDVKSENLFHDKHVISYPYEWSAEMYKDAVLFHLELFIELDKYGLTLKDALPSNILFDFTQPIFVDFLSLIKKENISNEKWLTDGTSFKDRCFAVVEKMLIPFMILPLIAMHNKNYFQAREMLSKRSCNMGKSSPQLIDVFKKNIINRPGSAKQYIKSKIKLLLRRNNHAYLDNLYIFLTSYKDKQEPCFIKYIQKLYNILKNLDVTPPSSGYASYYKEKKENYDFFNINTWGEKQKNVYEILNKEKPETVIDVGSNTGWFSFLAENIGANVIAMDIEEDCVNKIYLEAKDKNRRILPLLISFNDLSKEYYGNNDESPEYAGRDFKNIPLFLAPINRFKGDIVMCLGLIHHLVLGLNYSFDFIFETIIKMTKNSFIAEFISIEDKLIISEPSFFKNINLYDKENYNLDIFISAGSKYFKEVSIYHSHPETRKILHFKNRINKN